MVPCTATQINIQIHIAAEQEVPPLTIAPFTFLLLLAHASSPGDEGSTLYASIASASALVSIATRPDLWLKQNQARRPDG